MYLNAFSEAARLTQNSIKQIRRYEQTSSEQYEPPQVFKLIRVGLPRELEQGDTVLGKVRLVTTKKICCQLIFVEFKGLAKVDFTVPSRTMIDEIQNFHKEWEFFNHKIPLFLHENKGYNFLEPGNYEFYFKAKVPLGGPCSFYTDVASVTYRFSAALVRNDVSSDVHAENSIVYHVRGYKDLNYYDGARIGVWQERSTFTGGFLGMFQGRVHLRVKTDRRAYTPGEKIHITGTMSNSTWRQCTFRYELIQKCKMWGDHYFWRSDEWGNACQDDKLVMEKGVERALKPSHTIEINESLLIPKRIEPSYLGMTVRDYINEIIDLDYTLLFQIVIPMATDVKLNVPIIIGTEPFIFLPPVPETFSAQLSRDSSETSTKTVEGTYDPHRIKVDIENVGKYEPLRLPTLHPLNENFQSKFPNSYDSTEIETSENQTSSHTKSEGGFKKMSKNLSSKCKCACSKHKKKKHHHHHRSKCHKGKKRTEGSDSSLKSPQEIERIPRVTSRYASGIHPEEWTYTSWLSSVASDDRDDDTAKVADALIFTMKEYGIIS